MLKVVYILTGSGDVFLLNQLKISVASLQMHTPNVNIILLTDDNTKEFLLENKFNIKCGAIQAVEIDNVFSAKEKSRYLKTKMRSLVEGDFLYIDTDTVICEDLTDIHAVQRTSAVLDNNMPVSDKIWDFQGVIDRASRFGYSVGYDNKHFNGGVIWCKDDVDTHLFFNEWHNLWLETRKRGIVLDQLSLNEVNNRKNGFLNELDGMWNCQLRYGLPFLANAKILHYFASGLLGNNKRHFAYKVTDREILLNPIDEINSNSVLQTMLQKPRNAFNYAMLIEVETDNYYIINSYIGKALRFIYKKYYKLFEFLDFVLGKIARRLV